MQQHRSKMLAFLLNMIPGLGHYYYGSRLKGFIYGFIFFGSLGVAFLALVAGNNEGFAALCLLAAAVLWFISMFGMIIRLIREPDYPPYYPSYPQQHAHMPGGPEGPFEQQPYGFQPPEGYSHPDQGREPRRESERFYTILLSFVPGLGHLHLGLLQRGLSFLIGFFGLGIMLVFVAGITGQETVLLFLLLLPVLWLYCMFDAAQHVNRKQAGELLEDKTIFEQLEHGRGTGKKSKVLATLLAAFPGAGHMYLGLQKRGLQLMLIFLGSIYILDLLNLSLFLFFIPIAWFYSFFDGMQQAAKYGREPLVDKPVIEGWTRYQGWIGGALLFLGVYYLFIRIVVPELDFNYGFYIARIQSYMNTVVVALLMIGGGIRLLSSSRKKNTEAERFLRALERENK
ncbi:hypothetical protein D3C75_248870 [compost metagenome]